MTIRKATIDDAPFIALVVVEALGDDIMERYPEHIGGQDRRRLELLAESIRQDSTLYSWRHTAIAQDTDGTPLGAIVAYPADNYMQMRTSTFAMLSELISFDVESMDAEASPGEYYVDSIAVVPKARGQGIARQLLLHAIAKAQEMLLPAILACEPNNLGAKALYESLGFRHNGDLFIFGHHYLRMERAEKLKLRVNSPAHPPISSPYRGIEGVLTRLFNKACTAYGLLADGDRILLALSGGKDSLVMAQLMAERARIFKPSICVEAVHVVMDNVPYQTDILHMQTFCNALGIPLHILHTSFDETTDKRHTRCFLCARYRRKAMFRFAVEHGFNKVALGHHQDDFLATMLMNLLYEGSFHSMRPSMPMEHYPITIIRPLCLVPEKYIASHASEAQLVRHISPCPYEDRTRRSEMERLSQSLCTLHPEARQSMWHALEKGWD